MLAIRWQLKSELADAAYELAIDLQTGDQLMITARYVLDATEEADLLPLRERGWVVGAESASRIGEPHVLNGSADPWDEQAIAAQTRASVIPAHDHFAAATETVLSFLDIEVSESYWTSEVLLDQRRVRYSFNQIVTLGQKLDDGRTSRPAHYTLSQPTSHINTESAAAHGMDVGRRSVWRPATGGVRERKGNRHSPAY